VANQTTSVHRSVTQAWLTRSPVPYDRDILDEPTPPRTGYPEVDVQLGMVVEDRSSGFCGDVVRWSVEAVTLRDRRQHQRHFGWKPGGFLLAGRAVTLRRPAPVRTATMAVTASGSVVGDRQPARVAVASRIWVEGIHDAELLEHVWGSDLREASIVVEPMHGIDGLADAVTAFAPSAQRRLGVLVDHLVPSSKEQRLAATITGPHVLVTGHPFVDVWAGIQPRVVGRTEWPDVPRGLPWKEGVCRALGVEATRFWPKLRNSVQTYADLRPELVGAVERLLDFVA